MRIGSSRESIAEKIKIEVFNKHLLSLICDPKDMIKIIIYSGKSPSEIFFMLCKRIREKLLKYDATLKNIYTIKEGKRTKLTHENSNKNFLPVLNKDSSIIFEVNIRNKLFFFEAKSDNE